MHEPDKEISPRSNRVNKCVRAPCMTGLSGNNKSAAVFLPRFFVFRKLTAIDMPGVHSASSYVQESPLSSD